MKTVKEIVADYLREIGADGLCHPATECGCGVDDLQPCNYGNFECVPAKKVPVPDEYADDVDEWYVPMKEAAR